MGGKMPATLMSPPPTMFAKRVGTPGRIGSSNMALRKKKAVAFAQLPPLSKPVDDTENS